MTRRILVSYVLMAVVILSILVLPLGLVFGARERDRLVTAIERDSRVLAAAGDDAFEAGRYDTLPDLVDQYRRQTGGRVVMVDADGRSIVDSGDPGGPTRDFSTRPEIAAALEGRFTTGERESSTLGESLYYVAVPVVHGSDVLGAVRVTYPGTTVTHRTRVVWLQLVSLSGVTLVLVAAAGWIVASTLSRPVRALEAASDRLAAGDLAARVDSEMGPEDLRRVGRSFNSMADRLEALLRSQRSFLADASHQLRTPLTALRLRIESLSASASSPDGDALDAGELEAAEDEVDRLSNLVDGLLAMARLDDRPGAVEPVPVDAVIAERIEWWRPLADERGVDLVARTGAAGRASVVSGGLDQILDNLLANALEVAPSGSKVLVTSQAAGDRITVAVGDEGPGMTDAQQQRAFDRFWRGPHSAPGGSGLGLAIVRALAEASGGTAFLRGADPTGVTVGVVLPAHSGRDESHDGPGVPKDGGRTSL